MEEVGDNEKELLKVTGKGMPIEEENPQGYKKRFEIGTIQMKKYDTPQSGVSDAPKEYEKKLYFFAHQKLLDAEMVRFAKYQREFRNNQYSVEKGLTEEVVKRFGPSPTHWQDIINEKIHEVLFSEEENRYKMVDGLIGKNQRIRFIRERDINIENVLQFPFNEMSSKVRQLLTLLKGSNMREDANAEMI